MGKCTVVSTKDYNMAECLSAKRFTGTDLEEVISVLPNLNNLCQNIYRCKVEKCRLKEDIMKCREHIVEDLRRKAEDKIQAQTEKLNLIK